MPAVARPAGDDPLILRGRGISPGRGEGEVLKLDRPFSFLGGVDPKTGRLTASSGAEGSCIAGRVFVLPEGKGSTVGSYTIYQMKEEGSAPAAIVLGKAETIIVTGAVMAGLPLVDSVDVALLREGDQAVVDGSEGTIELRGVKESKVVTCVLRNGDSILMLKRSDKVSTNQGLWAGVSGYIEEGERPIDTAYKEIREEVRVERLQLAKVAPPLRVRSGDRIWEVHPFLFDVPDRAVTIDWEHTEYRWVRPGDVAALNAVPGFDRVLTLLL